VATSSGKYAIDFVDCATLNEMASFGAAVELSVEVVPGALEPAFAAGEVEVLPELLLFGLPELQLASARTVATTSVGIAA
jgi:hypothetical protein